MSKPFELIDDVGLADVPKINPKSMTDEELAKLRFTWLSSDEQDAVLKELEKRNQVK
ncbi:hypothetical protein IGI37_002085 [Enterococcus sp. AZ194]|uniref:hypothetical protein n=1 Tax=Enterococcus sp. AZ194 TaxID=2774629 RepID=UPI003F267DB2